MKEATFLCQYPWADAQAYCRRNYADLLTITSNGDATKLKNSEGASIQSWIGLSKKPLETVYTQWSDGTKLKFTAWMIGEPSHLETRHCVTIMDSEFATYNCSIPLMFYCYKWRPNVIVMQEMMNWDEALTYCRMHYTDLVSVTTETDMLVISQSLDNQEASVWTGLRFMDGQWFWVNQQTLQRLSSVPVCPARPFHCRAIGSDVALMSRNCDEKMKFIFYLKEQ